MEGVSRRNSSSDVAYAVQICIPAIRMTLQEAPMMGTCLMNIQEGSKTQKYLGESCCRHRIKYIAATFLAAFMWKRPLNSVTLATTQLTESQRGCLMRQVLKWRLRWSTSVELRCSKGSYIMWETFHEKRIEKIEREHCSNLNYLFIQLWSIYTSVTSSD